MRPLDGTIQAGCKGARHSNFSFARNAGQAQPGRGNCVIDASDRSLHRALREIGQQGRSSSMPTVR
jgi:hypothetical protein